MSRTTHGMYADELRAIVADRRSGDSAVVMFSGGVDSLLLALLAREVYSEVRLLTIVGVDTPDVERARDGARRLGLAQEEVEVSLDEILARRYDVEDDSVRTLFSWQFVLTHRIAFEKRSVEGLDVLQGDGADALYGSTTWRIYLRAKDVSEEEGVSIDEARTILKRRYYRDSVVKKKGTGHLFEAVAREYGANPIQPYRDPSLAWVSCLTYSSTRPDRKEFPRVVAAEAFGFDASYAKRVSMQEGSGIYGDLKTALVEATGAGSFNSAVREYVRTASHGKEAE